MKAFAGEVHISYEAIEEHASKREWSDTEFQTAKGRTKAGLANPTIATWDSQTKTVKVMFANETKYEWQWDDLGPRIGAPDGVEPKAAYVVGKKDRVALFFEDDAPHALVRPAKPYERPLVGELKSDGYDPTPVP